MSPACGRSLNLALPTASSYALHSMNVSKEPGLQEMASAAGYPAPASAQ